VIKIAGRSAIAASMLCMGTPAAHAQPASAPAVADAPAPVAEARVLFALIYRPGPNWRQGKPFREQIAIKEHFAYVKGLFANGQLFSGGGLGDDHGLVLFHARDQAEANAILAADPMVQAGSFVGEVRRYTPAFLSDRPLTMGRK